jgi:hypothetical protein
MIGYRVSTFTTSAEHVSSASTASYHPPPNSQLRFFNSIDPLFSRDPSYSKPQHSVLQTCSALVTMASTASDFQKLITDGTTACPWPICVWSCANDSIIARERKKNSALADRIFGRDRRQSAPSKLKPTPGGSLASRVGVKKVCSHEPNLSERRSMPRLYTTQVAVLLMEGLSDHIAARPCCRCRCPGQHP